MRSFRPATLLLISALAACGGSDNPVPSGGGDALLPGRPVSDADFRDLPPEVAMDAGSDGDGAIDGGDAADAGDDGAADGADGGDGGDAPAALRVMITVLSPAHFGVAPAAQKFTPEVDVLVDSPMGAASDAVKDVTAEVLDRTTRKMVVSGKLNQVGFRAVAETTQLIYNYADTPIDIASVPSGNYDLVVTVTTNGGAEFEAFRPFQIDAGPVIVINSPIKDKAYKGSAPIDVTVSDDYFAPVSDVQMKVGQTAIQFAGPGGASGHQYTATLDFASFIPALEGEQILTVRGKNKNGTESVLVRKFISDSKGPVFAEAKPKDGDLVGNVINISVEVTDPAGVLGSSVVAVFANGPGTEYTIPLRPPAAGDTKPLYSAVFDTRLLPFGENALFPTLSFRASDNLGNEALLTNVVWLDNKPPLADLDPPDMRIWGKTDSGSYGCSWPFDPVGNDAADDGEIVPQIVDIRARIEDQGNDPLSGAPNYIPIASVETAQLLVLDDISQPLLVNTNPVPVGSRKADNFCDAINPLLVPTTRPMTGSDALLVTLTSIPAAGLPNLTNGSHDLTIGDDRIPGGLDWACRGGDNAKWPDSFCEVSRTGPKARYGRDPILGRWLVHSDSITVFLGYAGGGSTTKMPSIWTIPKQDAGPANPLCGGTQLDTLANFVSDGWACLALFSSDKLGNKQVSRPMRLCVDKDADGKECPHKPIASVVSGTPIAVETVADHGLATGDDVRVSGITLMAMVNGPWKVTVTGPRTFTLDNSYIPTGAPVTAWTRPNPTASNPFVGGHVVRTRDLPNCTGTVTAATPAVVVDGTKSCDPWRLYQRGEMRAY